jgi:hypothetical protein
MKKLSLLILAFCFYKCTSQVSNNSMGGRCIDYQSTGEYFLTQLKNELARNHISRKNINDNFKSLIEFRNLNLVKIYKQLTVPEHAFLRFADNRKSTVYGMRGLFSDHFLRYFASECKANTDKDESIKELLECVDGFKVTAENWVKMLTVGNKWDNERKSNLCAEDAYECIICYEKPHNGFDILRCGNCSKSICQNCLKKMQKHELASFRGLRCPNCRAGSVNYKKLAEEVKKVNNNDECDIWTDAVLNYKVTFFLKSSVFFDVTKKWERSLVTSFLDISQLQLFVKPLTELFKNPTFYFSLSKLHSDLVYGLAHKSKKYDCLNILFDIMMNANKNPNNSQHENQLSDIACLLYLIFHDGVPLFIPEVLNAELATAMQNGEMPLQTYFTTWENFLNKHRRVIKFYQDKNGDPFGFMPEQTMQLLFNLEASNHEEFARVWPKFEKVYEKLYKSDAPYDYMTKVLLGPNFLESEVGLFDIRASLLNKSKFMDQHYKDSMQECKDASKLFEGKICKDWHLKWIKEYEFYHKLSIGVQSVLNNAMAEYANIGECSKETHNSIMCDINERLQSTYVKCRETCSK